MKEGRDYEYKLEENRNDSFICSIGLCGYNVNPYPYSRNKRIYYPGDAIVILSGVVLGPVWGLLAAGIGSAMADLLGGYFVYVPITFAVKGLIALFAGLVYQKMATDKKKKYIAVLIGGVIDIVLVAGGYFVCEYFLYGASAAASIPANIIQGVGGLVISIILYPILIAIPDINQMASPAKAQ